MQNSQTYRFAKIALLSLGSLIGVVVLLMLAVFGLWQTDWAKEKTLEMLHPTLQTVLTEPIEIQRFSGNLFSNVSVHKVHIGEHLNVDSIRVEYSLWNLIFPTHEVKSIQVFKPKITIRELPDSSLSIMKLIPETNDSTTIMPDVRLLDFVVSDAGLLLKTPLYTKQDSLFIYGIQINSGIEVSENGYRVDLNMLDFSFYHQKINDTLRLALNAKANQNQVSIGKLLLATTRSQFELQAVIDHSASQPEIKGGLKMDDFAWQDLKALEQKSPVQEDLNMQVSFYGKESLYGAQVHLNSESVDSLMVQVEGVYNKRPLLTEVLIQSGKTNIGSLLKLKEQVKWDSLSLKVSGSVPVFEPLTSNAKLSGFIQKLNTSEVNIDAISFGAQQVKERVQLYSTVRRSGGEIVVEAQIDSLNNHAAWKGRIQAKKVNLKSWLKPVSIQTNINSITRFAGFGLKPDELNGISVQTEINPSSVEKTELKQSSLTFRYDNKRAFTTLLMQLNRSQIEVKADYLQTDSVPGYSFKLASNGLNIADIEPLSFLKSDLKFVFEGRGNGINPSTMQISATARMDSSRFLGSRIDSLRGNFKLENGILSSNLVQLKSDFADAKLSGKGSVLNILDGKNELDAQLVFKNLEKFAPLLGLKDLQLRGQLQGKLRPATNFLSLNGSLDLDSVMLDSLQLEAIRGDLQLQIRDTTQFYSSLKALNPKYGTRQLRDFAINTKGIVCVDTISAEVGLNFSLLEKHAADLRTTVQGKLKKNDSFEVQGRIYQVDFQSIRRDFELETPVKWLYNGEHFVMDTMMVKSKDAFVRSFVDVTKKIQRVELDLKNIDFSAAYATLVSPIDAEFLTSGHIHFTHEGDSLEMLSSLAVSPVRIQHIQFDTLFFNSEIKQERLTTKLEIFRQETPWFLAQMDVPFKLGDPSTHEDEFYKRPLTAKIELQKTELADYQALFDSVQFGKVSGELQAKWELTGTTENPKIVSGIKLDSLLLNGVLVDSIRAATDYNPVKNQLLLSGFIHSLGKRVAEIDGYIPLYLDLKNHRKILPKDSDSFAIRAKANSFDLSTINDLLDEEQLNRLSGKLKVDLGLKGTIGKPQFDGYFNIEKGSVELVPHRIVLRDIETQIDFEGQSINLNTFTLKSNTGSASVSGKITSEKLQPKYVNLIMSAKNLQVSDTRNLKAKINTSLALSGDITNLDLSGSISANTADVYLENFGAKSVEAIELENEDSNQEYITQIYNGLQAEIVVTAKNDVWVRNREYPELSVELYGETKLVKQKNDDFQMFGEFNTRRGYAKQFSKRFNLDKGQFVFNGDPTNPTLAIETSYVLRQPQDVKIWYVIEGTVNEPKFTFKSEPNMELEDIVSYTIFGRPFAALMGWQQGIAGNSTSNGSVSDAAVGLLLDRVESYATEKLGIDVVEIDNSAASTGAGTSVRAGKYINQRTFVAIVQQLGGADPVSQVVIEYLIKNNLDLVLTQSSDDRSGVDLRWRFEY
ncbi:hypothetical protein EP331_07900 [bacterium]|nr:MAG: hypothetical protein EP331_07900 [bacterium]